MDVQPLLLTRLKKQAGTSRGPCAAGAAQQ